MQVYFFKRLLRFFPMTWLIASLVFLSLHLVPGDPVDILLGESASPVQREALRASLELDRPLTQQYLNYWKNLLQGNLGNSLIHKKPVAKLIAERIFSTVQLALITLALSLLVAIPMGCYCAFTKNKILEKIILFASILGVSLPTFWLGPILILIFSVTLGWLPVSEKGSWNSFVLPTITLSVGMTAVLVRMVWANVTEILHEEYIRTAYSKGLSSRRVLFKHALKNALIPVVSLLGIQMGSLLTGAVVTETIFDWPGIGEFAYRAIQARDFPVVQGCVLVIAVTYLSLNLVTDLLYYFIDPRVQLDS